MGQGLPWDNGLPRRQAPRRVRRSGSSVRYAPERSGPGHVRRSRSVLAVGEWFRQLSAAPAESLQAGRRRASVDCDEHRPDRHRDRVAERFRHLRLTTRASGNDNHPVDDRASRLPAFLAGRPKPYLMAHRGASDHAPENSRAAFQLAIEAGVDLIETDLWFTADRQIVCHHDATLDRMTGTPGRVDQLTLAEVQRRPIRSPFADRFPDERIVSLEEVLALVPPTIVLVLELKDPRFADPSWARLLTHHLEARLAATSVIVISFALERVLAVRAVDPRTPTGWITLHDFRPGQPVDVLGPFWPIVILNPFYVRRAHALGKWVCPLDLAAHRRLAWYRWLGVDAILTNDPAKLSRRLGRRARGDVPN